MLGPKFGKPLESSGDAPKDESTAEVDSAPKETQVELVTYSCHPAQRLQLHTFHFEKGVLRLALDKVEEFEKLLAQQPIQLQSMIKKIDVAAGNALIAQKQGGMSRGIDTTANSIGPKATDNEG